MTAPCMNCENREVGCHGKCEAYKAYTEEYKKIRAEQQKEALLRHSPSARKHTDKILMDLKAGRMKRR